MVVEIDVMKARIRPSPSGTTDSRQEAWTLFALWIRLAAVGNFILCLLIILESINVLQREPHVALWRIIWSCPSCSGRPSLCLSLIYGDLFYLASVLRDSISRIGQDWKYSPLCPGIGPPSWGNSSIFVVKAQPLAGLLFNNLYAPFLICSPQYHMQSGDVHVCPKRYSVPSQIHTIPILENKLLQSENGSQAVRLFRVVGIDQIIRWGICNVR